MYRLLVLALAMLLAITVAACGDKDVTTTPETSTPVQTTTTTQQPSPTPTDTPSVASVGDTINLTGQEEGERAAVTVVKVVDPAKLSSPDAGMRLVAVQFRLKNIGTQVVNEAPNNDAKVRDTQGQQFNSTIADTAAGPGFGGSVTLTPGDTALGFLVFEVPTGSKIDTIQFALASGFARDVGQWRVA